MQTEWEAALAAQRERVTMLLADGPCLVRDDPDARSEPCPLLDHPNLKPEHLCRLCGWRWAVLQDEHTALDNYGRLARAIGAAEACDCDGVACPYVGDVEAIIKRTLEPQYGGQSMFPWPTLNAKAREVDAEIARLNKALDERGKRIQQAHAERDALAEAAQPLLDLVLTKAEQDSSVDWAVKTVDAAKALREALTSMERGQA